MIKITWIQLLAGAFAFAVAIAGGTYTIFEFAKDSEIAGYKLRIEQLDLRVKQIEKRLDLCLKATKRKISSEVVPGSGVYVTLLKPRSGELVEHKSDVKYVVQGELPEHFRAILAIRDPLGQWWSHGSSPTGEHLKVQFGREKDRGESFEVHVLVTDKVFPMNNPKPVLPDSIASDSAIVVRK
jgi:hypothetical protein